MAETRVQVFANHRRWDPWYHFFVTPVVLVSFFVALWGFIKSLSAGFSAGAAWNVVVWAAVVAVVLILRTYPLRVQDRIVRLEERLRLATLLDGPLKARIPELDERQLVGLRFAADAEVPALVKAALDEKLSGEEIKKRVQNWRPDTFRV